MFAIFITDDLHYIHSFIISSSGCSSFSVGGASWTVQAGPRGQICLQLIPNHNLWAIRHSVDRALPALPALSALLDLQFLQLSQLFQLSQFCQFFHSSDTLSSPSSSNFEIENWKSWESLSTYEKNERTNRVGRAGKARRAAEIGDPRELEEPKGSEERET